MWNVWLGLKLLKGAGGAVPPPATTVYEGRIPRRRNMREQIEREDNEAVAMLQEFIRR